MTGSRSATGLLARSLASGSRWDQAYFHITDQALRFRQAGDFRSAAAEYQQGISEAIRRNDKLAEVRFLMSIGGCHFGLFEYREALQSFLSARERAAKIEDIIDLGAISGNLSSIYLQMWDISAAQRAAEDGLNTIKDAPTAYFVPQLLLQVGRIHALQKDGSAETYYLRAMEAARRNRDRESEARSWDWIGDEQFGRDDIASAEKSYMQAQSLRLATKSAEVGFSYQRLGALRLAQGRLTDAAQFTELARQSMQAGKRGWPDYVIFHQQGSIHLAQGAVASALEDFSKAIESTIRERINLLPARSSLTASNTGFEDKIYRSFIEVAADHAVRTGNRAWASRSFQALELNRAASLRESLALADVWREKLPSEYWETVGKFDAAQAKSLRTGTLDSSIPSLRLKITEMEAAAGLSFAVKKGENFRIQTSLNHFQAGLGESEIFLSFFLGRDSSYLWAVSRGAVHLYRLAPERIIAAHVAAFKEAVPRGSEEVEEHGSRLYEDLFGSLSKDERSKKHWLLSLDSVLFETPFAALSEKSREGQRAFMIERHSIQVVPGALMLRRLTDPTRTRGVFLGVGDPVYNVADPRWQADTAVRGANRPLRLAASRAGQLTRLAASSDEIKTSAATWEHNRGKAILLEGFDAGRDTFLGALSRRPSIIHLATHVLFSQTQGPEISREQAFVAFSIARDTRSEGPQYLTTARISTLDVPGTLVVMTGCATGTGDSRAGAGLLGLTRAWLMAGASGVLSTVWPVEDSTGEIFSRFYQYYPDASAAEALRRSQVEMSHRTPPSQWASYQLTGGLR